jgi:hypothetical protein
MINIALLRSAEWLAGRGYKHRTPTGVGKNIAPRLGWEKHRGPTGAKHRTPTGVGNHRTLNGVGTHRPLTWVGWIVACAAGDNACYFGWIRSTKVQMEIF